MMQIQIVCAVTSPVDCYDGNKNGDFDVAESAGIYRLIHILKKIVNKIV